MMPQKIDLNFKSLLTNRLYLLLSIGVGLVGVMIIFFGIIPQINQVHQLNSEIKTQQQKLKLLRQKTADLENIDAQEAYASVGLIDQVLPSKKPLLELLTALSAVAGKNNVAFTDLSLSPGEISSQSAQFLDAAKSTTGSKKSKSTSAVNKEGYATLDVELKAAGVFGNIQQFLSDVEAVAPLITIKSLSLNIKSEDIIKPSDQVEAELVVSVYYFTQNISAALESSLPNIGSREQEIVAEVKNYFYPSVAAQQQIISGGLDDLFSGLTAPEFELEGR